MTQAQKGTFLQLPSVFIETCDLEASAQIMYIRMLHNFGYKGAYTGSLRKLAHLVRMPKSTVDRMLTKLCDAHLISRGNTEASETEHSILQVSLDPEYLWNANIAYCNTHSVPNWDTNKKKRMSVPHKDKVSQDSTECPNLSKPCPNVGQSVPTDTLKVAPYITKTSNIIEDSLVVSADAENDAGISLLSQLSSFEENLQKVQNGQAPLQTSYGPHGCSLEEPGKLAGTSLEPAHTSAAHDTMPTRNTLQVKPTPEKQSALTSETHKQDELKIRRKMKECSPEIQARRRKWQAYFNQRRGGEALLTKKDCIAESRAIADLVDRFTDAQLEAIDAFVLAEIFKFKLPANKHKLGGCDLLRESQNAREVLKDRFKWPGQVIVPVEEPKIVGWTPVRQIYPPKGVTVTYG